MHRKKCVGVARKVGLPFLSYELQRMLAVELLSHMWGWVQSFHLETYREKWS
jgi:hypothetical protein